MRQNGSPGCDRKEIQKARQCPIGTHARNLLTFSSESCLLRKATLRGPLQRCRKTYIKAQRHETTRRPKVGKYGCMPHHIEVEY